MKTNFEPFRTKVVEQIRITDLDERKELLKEAGYNLFKIPSSAITIDLLSDSGTGALSDKQWASIMIGDEAYAGSKSFERFEEAVRNIFGFEHVIPTHQGRGAEHILATLLARENAMIPSNTHFDTTRANIEYKGIQAIDCHLDNLFDSTPDVIFKGNMDTNKLRKIISDYGTERIPAIMLTITNNLGGGLPVSMENIQEVSAIAKEFEIPFFIDAARFAENCYFIRQYEQDYSNLTVKEIARKLFSYADGCIVSARKDCLNSIGGFFTTNNSKLADQFKQLLVIFEGFPTYGGMAGRDMEAIAQGLEEGVNEEYLKHRISQVAFLGNKINEAGIPTIRPFGGHAIFINVKKMLGHIPPKQFPGQALACELYLEGGIRTCELGSLAFGTVTQPPFELLRLAIPRRVYSNTHLQYVSDCLDVINKRKDKIMGLKITKNYEFLRHFLAELEPAGKSKRLEHSKS